MKAGCPVGTVAGTPAACTSGRGGTTNIYVLVGVSGANEDLGTRSLGCSLRGGQVLGVDPGLTVSPDGPERVAAGGGHG